MELKVAATRLLPEIHGRLVAKAEAESTSLSEYLERLVLQDLDASDAADANPVVALLNKHHAEQMELISRTGELTFRTRAAFVNFLLLWSQLVAGKIEAKQLDFAKWCEDSITGQERSDDGNRL